MNKHGIIKKAMIAATVSLFAICCNAQEGYFLSPYKDGRPVADSLKDHSQPVKMNLLSSTKKTAVPVKQDNKTSNQQPANGTDEKTKVVVLSPAKKP